MRIHRYIPIFTLTWLLLMSMSCDTTWTAEASNILALIVPAITAALDILRAFGLGIPTQALTDVQNWAGQAQSALQTVASLITQYNSAEATAQPGILTEIQTAIGTVAQNLSTVLPEVHVTDPSTQAKIAAVFQAILAELTALVAVIPAVAPSSVKELKALAKKAEAVGLLDAEDFKKKFNSLVVGFGAEYQLK